MIEPALGDRRLQEKGEFSKTRELIPQLSVVEDRWDRKYKSEKEKLDRISAASQIRKIGAAVPAEAPCQAPDSAESADEFESYRKGLEAALKSDNLLEPFPVSLRYLKELTK